MVFSRLIRTCLKPSYSLRRQLLLSFGIAASVTLFVITSVACITAYLSGKTIMERSNQVLRDQIKNKLSANSRYVATTITEYMENLEKILQLTVELVQDRIVNYPFEGWEEDLHVPFLDMDSGRNIYPLQSQLIPLDWQVVANVNESNLEEHFQERHVWAKSLFPVSSFPAYFFQGICDPKETNTSAHFYYENCSDANNDWTTGGVVVPSPTNKGLYEKASDIGMLLKPIFETHSDLSLVGVYFKNSGAGSMVQYPGPSTNWGSMSLPYVSAGCDWMKNINPHSGKPFGTEEEIARCRPKGTNVLRRQYNPMEREWCQEIVSAPRVAFSGPFEHALSELQNMVLGKAVFDRMSGEFIGCAALSLASASIQGILNASKIHPSAELSILNFQDKTVFADTLGVGSAGQHVTNTGLLSDEELDTLLKSLNDNRIHGNVTEFDDSVYFTVLPISLPAVQGSNASEPQFLVIQRIGKDVFAAATSINDDIRQQVIQVCFLSLLFGVVGLTIVYITLWLVAKGLTEPLHWVKNVAWSIVNHNDKGSDQKLLLNNEATPSYHLTRGPKTEIKDLVSEFRSMVAGFSGEGAAALAYPDNYEITNKMTWQSDFQLLYSVTNQTTEDRSNRVPPVTRVTDDASDQKNIVSPDAGQDKASEKDEAKGKPENLPIVLRPPKKNRGTNSRPDPSNDFPKGVNKQREVTHCRQVYRSSLFRWILFLIVTPLLVTSFAIYFIVSYRIEHSVDSWISSAAIFSVQIEKESLRSATKLKALQARIVINSVIRDLHMMTRIAGWLLFDGLSRSESFTYVEQAAQECRNYSVDTCPFYQDKLRAVCSCQWNDSINLHSCFDYGENDTRNLQRRYFASQRRDYDAATGNRSKSTSYGLAGIDDKPSTTLWWDDVDELPGSEKGANASGFVTAYDRLRVTSAMAVIDVPLYNYARSIVTPRQELNFRVAFEADGMETGYAGCGHYVYAKAAFFQSTRENRAASIAPQLCPIGKFGYDPRCRDWYFDGKRFFKSKKQPLHITSPYFVATENFTTISATAPLANPSTGSYIGQTHISFLPTELQRLLDDLGNFVSVVVAADGDYIVVGSGVSMLKNPNYPFLYEDDAATLKQNMIDRILERTKIGEDGTVQLVRQRKDKSKETLTLAYEPVNARAVLPIDPSDYLRGCEVKEVLVYSVGIAYSEVDFQGPWNNVESDIDGEVEEMRNIYIATVSIVVIAFAVIACMITFAVTKPVLTLLQIVQLINHRKISENIPALMGGSREVTQVYNSFAKLCRIIRMSNVAYFAGNPKRAYAFISDALHLYQMIDDKKAIGIACNNLGNTLHAMCKDMKHPGDCCRSIPGICIVNEAQSHYKEAILIAEQQLDQEIDEERKAEFALQLADRLFNRALFFLLVDGEACAPADALQRGLADLALSRRLSHDLKSFWLDRQLLYEHSSTYFYRLLQRSVGLLQFYDSDDVRAVWDVNNIVEEGDSLLFAAWDQPMSPLFDTMSRVGRLQQLESVAMRLDMCKGRKIHAARLAMRMFAEDEYILESAFMISSDVLLKLMRDPCCDLGSWSTQTKLSAKAHIRKMLRTCRQVNLDVGKCLIFALEVNERFEGDPLFDRVNELCLILYDELHDDDYMGLAAYTTRGDLNVPVTLKSNNSTIQRHYLNVATTSTSERTCPSWPYAAQMVIDSAASMECDTYILLILDGYSWDPFAALTVKNQIDTMNQERETKVHVFILGMDIEEADVKEECQAMCNITKLSKYMDIDLDNVDASFDLISDLIRGRVVRGDGVPGVIMEKF